jgi:hypothetical protein
MRHTAGLASVMLLAVGALGAGAQPRQATAPPQLPIASQGRLQTAVSDPDLLSSSNAARRLTRIRATGATAVRFSMNWAAIAPGGAIRPAGFDAADPADPHYRWTSIDALVQLVVLHGLQPIVMILDAPRWAEGSGDGRPGSRRPDPAELGLFARAAATRYNGSFQGLPRIRYWQVWNEPNLFGYVSPQIVRGKLVAGVWYRGMLNAAAAAIHSVAADDVVIAAGLSPFGVHGWHVSTPPLEFMRQMLCMRGRKKPVAACSARAVFDIWAQHPYTLGNPSHHARRVDDVSIPELPRVQRVLTAAWRAGHIKARRRPLLWVTELSWDTKPPDPEGVPLRLQARWVAEALFRLWRMGVPLVTWFELQDETLSQGQFQSGLYFHDSGAISRPKLTLTAFRFPFVALRSNGRVIVWGRTPNSRRENVAVQQRLGRRWRRVATIRANRFGLFVRSLKVGPSGSFRALIRGQATSLAYAVKEPPDMTLDNPFGS